MRKNLTLLAVSLALTGCASIKHERDVIVDGKVVGREVEQASGFLMKAAVDGLRSSTKDGTYTHTFTAKSAQTSGDTDMLKTAIESTGTAVGNAGHKAAVGQ